MADQPGSRFPLVDRYRGSEMGVDFGSLRPGSVTVVETSSRLERVQGLNSVYALWWAWLADGRSVVSVPPGAGEAVARILKDADSPQHVHDPKLAERLCVPINDLLRKAGREKISRVLPKLWFACNASTLRRHPCEDCRRLFDDGMPFTPGLELPEFSLREWVVYGVVVEEKVVSVAAALPVHSMGDRVAEIYVETAPRYWRRSYAKMALATLVEHLTRRGGEASYRCQADNHASIATARSVGFVPYGTSLALLTSASAGPPPGRAKR